MSAVEKMSPEDFKAIREFIYEKSGLFFSDAKLYFIENRVSKRLAHHQMTRYADYLKHIKNTLNRNELFELFNSVTTNETSFYRNPPQVDAFARNILPKVVAEAKARGQRFLKIWSAACSSGEEPYTIAMILAEKKELLQGLQPRIYATDISREVLDKVKAGLYQAYTMRNLSDRQKASFFDKEDQLFRVNANLKHMVKTSYFNLVDYRGYAQYRTMDVIFCRNVLIYFDLKVKREIIKQFYQSLNSKSYLLIGHSESLHNVNRDFKMEHFSRALAYIKPE